MQTQARICPICIDDHGEERECKREDLVERIQGLTGRVVRLLDALDNAEQCMAHEIHPITNKCHANCIKCETAAVVETRGV